MVIHDKSPAYVTALSHGFFSQHAIQLQHRETRKGLPMLQQNCLLAEPVLTINAQSRVEKGLHKRYKVTMDAGESCIHASSFALHMETRKHTRRRVCIGLQGTDAGGSCLSFRKDAKMEIYLSQPLPKHVLFCKKC